MPRNTAPRRVLDDRRHVKIRSAASHGAARCVLGVDIGGTFTDFVLHGARRPAA